MAALILSGHWTGCHISVRAYLQSYIQGLSESGPPSSITPPEDGWNLAFLERKHEYRGQKAWVRG